MLANLTVHLTPLFFLFSSHWEIKTSFPYFIAVLFLGMADVLQIKSSYKIQTQDFKERWAECCVAPLDMGYFGIIGMDISYCLKTQIKEGLF